MTGDRLAGGHVRNFDPLGDSRAQRAMDGVG